MKGALALCAAALIATSVHGQSWTLNLIDNTKYPMAQCLDGSPGGFYFSPGSGPDASKFLIHTQGGGWCISDQDCLGRSQSPLGSSKAWAASGCPNSNSPVCYADGGAAGMIQSDPSLNPLTANYSKVFINYCDGGSYAGTVEQPVTVGSSTIYYRGRFILDAIYDMLLGGGFGLEKSSLVVIKGCSAGGLAVYLHADYLAGRINAVNPSARVVAAPGAGFFLGDTPGFDGSYHYLANYQWVFSRMNVSGSINDACVADKTATNTTWQCYIAPFVLPYMKLPVFISNALPDAWQAGNVMGLPCNPGSCSNATVEAEVVQYLVNFRATMVSALTPVITNPVHGGFLQSCFVHVVEDIDHSWNGVKVGGQTQLQTFAAWLGFAPGARLVIDGNWGTNPTC